MDRFPAYPRRRFMDDSVYRTGAATPVDCTDLVDLRAPRYSSSLGHNDRRSTAYFDGALNDPYDHHSSSMYDQDFYGYDGDRLGGNEVIRRVNREAAVANAAILHFSPNVQLHPMMTADGRYPSNFSMPRRLMDFAHMREAELDRIMMAYDLGAGRRRFYRGNVMNSFADDDVFNGSKSEQRRNLVALFEFLGAHRVVEHLRYR